MIAIIGLALVTVVLLFLRMEHRQSKTLLGSCAGLFWALAALAVLVLVLGAMSGVV